ncbi:UDP-galactopyranose mutase [Petrotoga halophila]|jgi:UDP-galactopyranose mutase|uniref:UDP-galactopyranose mutase n=1 Tax=Petrotoga halophila DSM 16923 TaxID=1122953 RepID=A0A2S5E9D2_9BACT|nr:UDP-galactopyranose mutase [Petrotoga halophila]POZ89638.1 UDP-galactopyranose mutase [Petrotoga halophila DSM 16923]
MNCDLLIVGAGLAGSTVARMLAEKGRKVLIVEQHKHIAGHCYDYKDQEGITVHKYGPHIFHTNNKKVWDFVNRFTEFNYYQHRVLSYADGNYVPFPINRDTIKEVFGIEIPTFEINEFLKKEVEKSKFNDPPKNFKDVVVSQVGEKLYETFFKNYTWKQWGRDPQELAPEVAKRIPVRENRDKRYFSDKYQGIPKNGYAQMVENMLDHENISILLGMNYFDIKDQIKANITIYTGELDRFFDYKYGKLEYRSLELRLKTFDQEYYQPVATVNYPNDYDWTRITEFKHFLNEKTNKTTVCFEYPKAEGEPYYIVMTDENMKKREQYMEEVKKLEEQGNFLFVGRLAEYKYYNMDQVIGEALTRSVRI